jgi:hypothetical protein
MPPRESGSRQRILQQSKPTVVRSLYAALSPDKTTRAAAAEGRNNSRDHAGKRANQNVPMIRGVRITTERSGAVITWQYRSRPRGDGAAPPFAVGASVPEAGGVRAEGENEEAHDDDTSVPHVSTRRWAMGRGPCETLEAHESRGA